MTFSTPNTKYSYSKVAKGDKYEPLLQSLWLLNGREAKKIKLGFVEQICLTTFSSFPLNYAKAILRWCAFWNDQMINYNAVSPSPIL